MFVGVVAIFTYQLTQADKNFAKAAVPFAAVTNYTTLIQVAKKHGVITEEELQLLQEWRAHFKN